jgi:DNA-directed RNA polymerase sigma subunit (sigma70/sigma32)
MPSPAVVSLNSISEELLEMPSWGIVDDSLDGKRERLAALLPQAPNRLSDRELEVVRRWYGFSGIRIHTFAQIGDPLGVSRERARQILRRAEQKVAHSLSVLTLGDE